LIGVESEEEIVAKRLYDETKLLLESMQDVIQKVEAVLSERESITKAEVKKYIDEIL
jgi:hypothetical protein